MKNTTKKESIYKRTRTDLLPAYGTNNELRQEAEELREAHRSEYWGYDRAAAVVIRSHLREQFPECKFSVTSGGAGWLNKVNIGLKAAPYEKDGEIVKAIDAKNNKDAANIEIEYNRLHQYKGVEVF